MKCFKDINETDLVYIIVPSGTVIEVDVIRQGDTLLIADDSYNIKELDISNCLNNNCIILNDNAAIVLDINNVVKAIKHLKTAIKEALKNLDYYEELYKSKV